MPGAPLVSVVMPVYNGEAYVREAVDSILRQTLGDFELIIFDDGSTDRTPEILRDLARADPRIRLLRHEVSDVIGAVNRGCAEARGPYIARMDADDIAFPERLERQIGHLDPRPGLAVLGAAMQYLGPDGPLPHLLRHPSEAGEVRMALQQRCSLAHPTVVIRRAVFAAAGGYRHAFVHAEDYDLWLRIAERHDLANLPEPLLYHRLHRGQVSFAQMPQQVMSALGAQAAAGLRRAGRVEPALDRAPITRRDLVAMGVDDATIEATLIQTYIDRGDLLAGLGSEDQAWRIADEMARLPVTGAAGRRLPAEIFWLRGKVEIRRGRWLRGLGWAGRACLRRPATLGRLLRTVGRTLGLGA